MLLITPWNGDDVLSFFGNVWEQVLKVLKVWMSPLTLLLSFHRVPSRPRYPPHPFPPSCMERCWTESAGPRNASFCSPVFLRLNCDADFTLLFVNFWSIIRGKVKKKKRKAESQPPSSKKKTSRDAVGNSSASFTVRCERSDASTNPCWWTQCEFKL